MRRNTWMSVVLVFSLSLNFGFMGVWAYHFFYVRPLIRERPGEGGAGSVGAAPALEELRLRADQRRKFMAHRAEMRPEFQRISRDANAAQDRFLQVLAQPDPDPQAVQEALEKAVAEEAKLRRMVFTALKQFRDTLDEQQRRELWRMLHGRRGPGPKGPHRRGGWPPGRRPHMQQHRPSRDPEGAAPGAPEPL